MKTYLLGILKLILIPFALLYGLGILIRNKLYDSGFYSSVKFSLPVICVGNLSVGGTGKSPHIEYLIKKINPHYKTATLSRGYGRHSKGFLLANETSTSREIGDEPLQFKKKFPQISVAVAEERMTAIPFLLQQIPDIKCILLDDAFQHRSVKAGLNILLSDYNFPYFNDYILPFGRLREFKSAAKRAEIIIISKCPENLIKSEIEHFKSKINLLAKQKLFFTTIQYNDFYSLNRTPFNLNKKTKVLLLAGIANPEPLYKFLKTKVDVIHPLYFKDHHYYSTDDLKDIKEAFDNFNDENKIIITTEKDVSRLLLKEKEINEMKLPILVAPIEIKFLFNQENDFLDLILQFNKTYYPEVEENWQDDDISPPFYNA